MALESTNDVGTLYKITDLSSAKRAIEEIVEQGEGTSVHNPVDESTKHFAHFFRFEEIFCENELQPLPDMGGYAYTGSPIPYNPNGVWNMKDGLAISDIKTPYVILMLEHFTRFTEYFCMCYKKPLLAIHKG